MLIFLVPIPTYILGPNSAEHVHLYPADESWELCENVYYLGSLIKKMVYFLQSKVSGKRGVYTNSKGLKIAYLSGISSNESSQYQYSSKDITELYNVCVRGNPNFQGVDLLLTSQWPSNIMNNDNKNVISTLIFLLK